MSKIERPTDVVIKQDRFGFNEVGLNHPVTSSFIRLTDNGDIEIFAGEGVGIVLSNANKSITFVADQVRFMTKSKDGLRWNGLSANPNGYKFTEPPWVPFSVDESQNVYAGIDDIIEVD